MQLPVEAREALRGYTDSVRRTAATRSFIQLADDFQPPGGALGRVGLGGGQPGGMAPLVACRVLAKIGA